MNEKLMGPSDIMQRLNISRYKLSYLFDSRRLKAEEFMSINGRKIFRESDISKIKQALFATQNK